MDVPQSILCEPGAERHPTREGSHFRRDRSFFAWGRPFQSMLTMWISEGDLERSRLRLESALASVALMLLAETLVGHKVTLFVFALVVAMSLCGRIGRPVVLLTAIVLLSAHAFVLESVSKSSWMTTVWVVVWGLEGLLINVLLVELLTGAAGFYGSSNALHRARDACRSDRTRLKFLLESSSQSKERFRLMVESIRDYAIVMLDTAGSIVSWNAGAERILGYPALEIIGRNHALFYPSAEVRRGAPQSILDDAQTKETCEVEGWRRRKDGSELWAQVGVTPLRSGSGSMRGFAMVIRDTTERKQAEEWLRQARDELEVRVRDRTAELAEANNALQAEVLERKQAQEVLRQQSQELKEAKEAAEAASRAKDQFLAVLSHELRTPLTPVLLAVSDLLGNPDLDGDVRTTLTMIHRNVEVESRLIDDLLDVTRANTGRLTLDLALVDAHRNIQLAAEVCRAALTESELDLLLELEATMHHVNADPARLQQVFWNLIQNAVKFTPRGGRITIRTRNEPALHGGDDDVRLVAEVTDTGIGIDHDRLPKIFTAFEQRDPVLRRRYGGLGLGLAISRSVVEAHGGRLTGYSAGKDEGAAFTIELAAQPGPAPASIASDAPLAPLEDSRTEPEGLRILLIEDNPDTLRYLALLLRKQRHEVSTAQDVRTAIILIKSAVFDLIISDIELPDGNGLEIIREVHQVRSTPAIALSGFGSVDDIAQSRDAGFTEHLTKPIDVRELVAAIARAAPGPGGEMPSVMPSCREPLAPSSIAEKVVADRADEFGPWLSRSHWQPGSRDVADQEGNFGGCKQSSS
jgi:PAS domain S-box-containing protein